jgi:hypothetical protein
MLLPIMPQTMPQTMHKIPHNIRPHCRYFAAVYGTLLALVISSCATPPTPPPAPTPIDTAAVAELLQQAAQANSAERWIDPYPGSAVDYFRQTLALDPYNATALRGIENITETQAAKARQAADRQQYNLAWLELDRARRADPMHPTLKPTASYLQLQENSKRYRVEFPATDLSSRSKDTRLALQTLGEQAKQPDCRAIITSANDAQGRWMYQQMNQADGANRLRAALETGAPSSVAVLCF